MQVFICDSCGAKLMCDMNTVSSVCKFCGSHNLICERLSGKSRPNVMIPFQITRDEAVKKFIEWCKESKFAPVDFVSTKNIEKITGLYVPFWLYSAKGNVDIEGYGYTTFSSLLFNKTEKYHFVRKGPISWTDIPFDGETRIDDQLMKEIEPFRTSDLVPFNPSYLQGFFTECYDQSSKDLDVKIRKRQDETLFTTNGRNGTKYDRVRFKRNVRDINKCLTLYALFPVWFVNYKYLGHDYCFVVNGQTGEVAGKRPLSIAKYSILAVVCFC